MKITSLGYSPVNKSTNYENKQQNAPAFKGILIGHVKDASKLGRFDFFKRIKKMQVLIGEETCQPVTVTGRFVGMKARFKMIFDATYDKKMAEAVDYWNNLPRNKKRGIRFDFVLDEKDADIKAMEKPKQKEKIKRKTTRSKKAA
jgi:hypothetical protein